MLLKIFYALLPHIVWQIKCFANFTVHIVRRCRIKIYVDFTITNFVTDWLLSDT